MGKYVLVYTGGSTPDSEEEREHLMVAWQDWLNGLGDRVADWGAPFGASSAVNGTETEAHLTGYSILNAESLDDAVRAAESCPVFASGGGVEVYETLQM